MIHSRYENEKAVLRNLYKEEEAKIKKGVRQGCSPLIFNAHIQEAVDKIRNGCEVGVKVNGQKIDMLGYADDIAIVTETKEDLLKSPKYNGNDPI